MPASTLLPAQSLRAGTASSPPPHLGAAPVGFRGRIRALAPAGSTLPPAELERRLLELGFSEGAMVELLHEGAFGHDPIAVRVGGVTVALRRREAASVLLDAQD
jgi:ferrous iron transport protein A